MTGPASATLYGQLAAAAARTPDKIFIVRDGAPLTYAAFLAEVERRRGGLAARGIGPGRRVLLGRSNKMDFAIALAATIGSGATAVVAAGDPSDIVADCDPDFVADEGAIAAADPNRPGMHRAEADASALILYTSGATGARKGVVLSHAALARSAANLAEAMRLDASLVDYVAAPLDHAFGLGRIRAAIAVGGTVVLDEGPFNPARLLLAVERFGANALSSTSAGFALLLRYFAKPMARVGAAFKWAEIGSLPLPAEDKRAVLALLPRAVAAMNYGLTEAMRSTFLDMRARPDKLDTVGRAAPGAEIAVEDDGEIAVRGPHLASGYWRRPAETAARFVGGRFLTGDFGRLDGEGFLTFLGRKDDAINFGGEKIAPETIEARLAPLFPGRDLCVVGAPDEAGIYGEVPVLCIEGPPLPIDAEAIRTALAGIAPDAAAPRRAVFRDRLPRTPNGKIRRRAVRESMN